MRKPSVKIKSRLLSNHRLISLETVLLMGLLENAGESMVMQTGWPDPIKTLLIMLLIAGAFGVVMVLLFSATKQLLSRGNKAVQSLPVPTPLLVIHGVLLGGIYWLYTTQW